MRLSQGRNLFIKVNLNISNLTCHNPFPLACRSLPHPTSTTAALNCETPERRSGVDKLYMKTDDPDKGTMRRGPVLCYDRCDSEKNSSSPFSIDCSGNRARAPQATSDRDSQPQPQ
ncbi:hypothetical protein CDAR_445661 [Caerostris darwini]|uniref:Uncharacterized protein n=1 Tax=Caerostris darwini TaxID=1538125 RepID=A0AAV4U7B8_9ARAC|nr:hypothetical protein CDAR_445661 [Caerostris darwini]